MMMMMLLPIGLLGADSGGSAITDALAAVLVVLVPALVAALRAWLRSRGVASAMAAGVDSAEARIEAAIVKALGAPATSVLSAAGIDLGAVARSASKATKRAIQSVAEDAGVEAAVNAVVKSGAVEAQAKRATRATRPAVDAEGRPVLPKLALLIALCLLPALGCVSQEIHRSATQLKSAFAVYRDATVVNARYNTTGDPSFDAAVEAKVKQLAASIDANIDAILEASK